LHSITQTTIVSADYQLEGRGQRATKWQSSKAQNVLFSIFVAWKDLNIDDQFIVSMLAAIAVYEVIQKETSGKTQIKWPNDVYLNTKKLGGILIESDLSGLKVTSSIIGIGININQIEFENQPKATSLKLESGQEHDRQGIIKKIVSEFLLICQEIAGKHDAFDCIKQRYLSILLGMNQHVNVKVVGKDQRMILTPIDVSRSGFLLAVDEFQRLHSFDIKEIVWEI
jgi:BirA family biotin operon repressor/biotin-[acetyl-CoA-carboxylase] ligase